jgi:4-aminobutyrate aminotransferase/(S)-3-amino-2-methylpropionate transaminase
VQTGFGRTGAWFASEHDGIVADLVVTAKGIAGGLPLSAVTGRAEIMDSAMAGGLGGTYGGNPLACVAALAAIESYEEDGLIERAREIGAVLLGRLNALRTADARIGDVRGRGAMVAIELVDPATGAPDAALTAAVARHAHSNGVLVLTCGTYGNVIRFLPPLTITDELLIDGLGVVAEGLKTA